MHICAHIKELETERIGAKVQVWGSGKWLLVSLCTQREGNRGEGGGGLTLLLRWRTETLQSTAGAGLVPPRHGHGAEWKLSPLTRRHLGKLSVLDILK